MAYGGLVGGSVVGVGEVGVLGVVGFDGVSVGLAEVVYFLWLVSGVRVVYVGGDSVVYVLEYARDIWCVLIVIPGLRAVFLVDRFKECFGRVIIAGLDCLFLDKMWVVRRFRVWNK